MANKKNITLDSSLITSDFTSGRVLTANKLNLQYTYSTLLTQGIISALNEFYYKNQNETLSTETSVSDISSVMKNCLDGIIKRYWKTNESNVVYGEYGFYSRENTVEVNLKLKVIDNDNSESYLSLNCDQIETNKGINFYDSNNILESSIQCINDKYNLDINKINATELVLKRLSDPVSTGYGSIRSGTIYNYGNSNTKNIYFKTDPISTNEYGHFELDNNNKVNGDINSLSLTDKLTFGTNSSWNNNEIFLTKTGGKLLLDDLKVHNEYADNDIQYESDINLNDNNKLKIKKYSDVTISTNEYTHKHLIELDDYGLMLEYIYQQYDTQDGSYQNDDKYRLNITNFGISIYHEDKDGQTDSYNLFKQCNRVDIMYDYKNHFYSLTSNTELNLRGSYGETCVDATICFNSYKSQIGAFQYIQNLFPLDILVPCSGNIKIDFPSSSSSFAAGGKCEITGLQIVNINNTYKLRIYAVIHYANYSTINVSNSYSGDIVTMVYSQIDSFDIPLTSEYSSKFNFVHKYLD